MALDHWQNAAAQGSAAPATDQVPGRNSTRTHTPVNAADSDHARQLRAIVAARVAEPKPTAQTMRDALAAAARAIPGLGRSRDTGAERGWRRAACQAGAAQNRALSRQRFPRRACASGR